MRFSKGDRVRVKKSAWVDMGATGTVRESSDSEALVATDGTNGGLWWYRADEIDRIEESKPTDSIHVDNIVHNPPHYTGFSNGAEVVDIAENLPFNRGCAVKYLARAGKKHPDRELEDLKKALWFVAREIERLEKSEKKEEK